jgi:hypothetical protein
MYSAVLCVVKISPLDVERVEAASGPTECLCSFPALRLAFQSPLSDVRGLPWTPIQPFIALHWH